MNNPSDDTTTTLVTKGVPAVITDTVDQARDYFAQYQARDVRIMQGPAMKGTVFLDFANRETAAQAYQQLLTIEFEGHKKLRVEYATPNPKRTTSGSKNLSAMAKTTKEPEPIAPNLGIQFPSNPHLCYRYPDPTPETLSNIMHAIATVPRLYVQVLHLMNKMNLAPPFGAVDRSAIPSLLKRKHDSMLASDESELESDDEAKREEEEEKIRMTKVAALERKNVLRRSAHRPEPSVSVGRDAKRIKIVINKGQEEDEVPKKQPDNKPIDQQPNLEEKVQSDTAEEKTADREIASDNGMFLTMNHIESNCMKPEDYANLPAFKNYMPGEPSNKLYIKNLAKQVEHDDLRRLFGRFVWNATGSVGPDDLMIDLKEKRGPLRGQAFITFKDISIAKIALEKANAYMMYNKPMSIQFKRVKPTDA
ncbi:RNA-binding region-containing protein 3 [Apophysomyces sp. BC1015]|nr:RNA-binding region-containing protein 3 [Apophysomyces sp. BC1015]